MVYDYIINNFKNGEPIFLSELPGESKDYLRQEMKKLVDEGKLERLYNGVYYISYITILGTKGKISVDKYIEKNGSFSLSVKKEALHKWIKRGFTATNKARIKIEDIIG